MKSTGGTLSLTLPWARARLSMHINSPARAAGADAIITIKGEELSFNVKSHSSTDTVGILPILDVFA